MKKKKKINNIYNSYEEYLSKNYPKASARTISALKTETPSNLGIEMAKETLHKVKHLLKPV